MFKKYKEDPMI